ncbi:hypothetical protein QAD02_007305 [Eretmocerus hayati]|uniref:Uncharacterized protein n=1 Tax=Eretmocerus hayati TaxID=131215 RepID=A0ACC2N4J1_9HYME|nr:hypothetical protein QAD02_007305 [Eretmocerus hayati]
MVRVTGKLLDARGRSVNATLRGDPALSDNGHQVSSGLVDQGQQMAPGHGGGWSRWWRDVDGTRGGPQVAVVPAWPRSERAQVVVVSARPRSKRVCGAERNQVLVVLGASADDEVSICQLL